MSVRHVDSGEIQYFNIVLLSIMSTPQYTVLRIKRKATDSPLSSLGTSPLLGG